MPTVPRISVPQVEQSRAPNVALQANASPQAFGAGLGQAGQAIARVAMDAHELQVETQVKASRSKLVEWELQAVDDPQNGALATQGVDALGTPDKVLPDLDKQIGMLEDGIKSPRGKQIFRQMADGFRQDVQRKLNAHVAREGEKYADQQTDSTLALSLQAAATNYRDPNRVANELKYTVGIVMADARRKGQSLKTTKERIVSAQSGIHAAVLDQMLLDGSYIQAKAYFDANSVDMTPEVRTRAEKLVADGSARVQAKAEVDRLFKAHGQDFGAINAGLKDIADPKVRDYAEVEATQERERRSAADRLRRDRAMHEATNIVELTKDFTRIPPQTLELLSVSERAALKSYAKKTVGDGEVVTDPKKYAELSNMMVDDPDGFASLNMLSYVADLSETDWQMWQDRQTKFRTNPKDPEFAAIATTQQRLNTKMEEVLGFDPRSKKLSKENEVKRDAFQSAFEQRMAAFKAENGRVANTKDAQAILDQMTIEVAVQRSALGQDWLATDDVLRAYEVTDQDVPVPSVHREIIIERLSQKGVPVTDAAIRLEYAKYLGAHGK